MGLFRMEWVEMAEVTVGIGPGSFIRRVKVICRGRNRL